MNTEPSYRSTARSLYLKMAWRNLWRNKKRTLIAAASIFFAVFLAVLMSSMTAGSHDYMINAAVRFSTGHIQIHGKGYWDKRSLDESMVYDSALVKAVAGLPEVAHVVPRFESVALVSHGNVTKVSPVTGIDPPQENAMTSLGSRLLRGVPLLQWTHGAMIAEGLGALLGADIGDSIVIYGQGYQGVTAAAVVPITGVLKFPIPDMNNTGIYLPMSEAQGLFAAPDRMTSLSILLRGDEHIDDAEKALAPMIRPDQEVMTWRQMLPELVQALTVDSGGTVIMLLVLYVVIGFGIFGTVMMMTAERRHEFGVTIAVGMKRWRLAVITAIEAVLVSLIGAIAGTLAAIPVVLYFAHSPIYLTGDYAELMLSYGMEPILPFSTDATNFIIQGIVVFILGAVSAVYPAMVLRSLDPVRAMPR